MPVYEFKCNKCQHEFSQFFFGYSTNDKKCPNCGETEDLSKKISSPCSMKKNSHGSTDSACSSCSTKNCGNCGV